MVTTDGDGTDFGARYSPAELIVPTDALPPATPDTFQLTDLLEVFCTVAVNCCVRLIRTTALAGDTVMLTGSAGAIST